MKAEELVPGETYHYIGGSLAEPVERRYMGPIPWALNAYVFVGDKNRTYTLFGPDLYWLYVWESEAWDAMANENEQEGRRFTSVCRERARQLREQDES